MIDTIYSDPNFLEHHGVKGMKWGVRRYQNKDGSLTNLGQKRAAAAIEQDHKQGGNQSVTGEIMSKTISKDTVDQLLNNSAEIGKCGMAEDIYDDYESKEYADFYSEAVDMVNSNFEEYVGRSREELQADIDYYNQKNGTKTTIEESKPFDRAVSYLMYDDTELSRKYKKLWEENHPENVEAKKKVDALFAERERICKKAADEILGSYGNTPVTSGKSKYDTRTAKELLARYMDYEF